ncbi:DUF4097 family beta strand repeat-containing protein [Mucilaginibacter gotjawali]|uniref:DUF4097 domain-containing protein n=2 Tax=Mucilaginibacter gotjawali TaxID=1550579 RepID=A0A110B2X3_9SPHI|nr:DUF4097 family beta strand repeat-containing protein [Mucilaginibacter gotjawali]MBB3054118.1 DUF4097 and DUF4098 domain-containing protein YvlB [Mucilaginibacter gotjawali]BAU54386.1 hypothetical protein MgSA37_02562 [Mucilaginibacter gotjawali]
MKTYLLLLFIACQSCVALGQDWNKSPYETKSLANDAIKNVYVKTSGGSITVSGTPGETPRVEIYVHGNNNSDLTREEIKKRLEADYQLEVSVSNNEVHAFAKRKHEGGFNWDWRKQLSISFKIYVPKAVNTHLETSGGNIHLDNLSGNENFSTSGGSLHLNALAGIIKGETSGGSIEVSNSADDINLETSGGSIKAMDCHGKIRLETSGGSLHLQDLKGEIHAETSGGSIHADNIEGELITGTSGGSVDLTRMACSLQAETSGGSMNVDMARIGKYVKLDVSGGHVTLRLPAKQGLDLNLSANRISKPDLSGFSGEWEKDHVRGKLNGGGVPVNVDASGHLDISFN